jgi:hypothetical protein
MKASPISVRLIPTVLIALGLTTLSGCATLFAMMGAPQWSPGTNSPTSTAQSIRISYRTPEEINKPLTKDEKAVLASANSLLGKGPSSKVSVNGRTFTLDCIGTVSAIFYGMHIDVQADFSRYSGNGVNRLYESLKALNVLHRDSYPRPGDVIFWDNTWDANGDGKLNDDPRTHAGVVIAVDTDGTIHYVHEHVVKGVTVEVMNLLHPNDYYGSDGKIINNALALNSGITRKDNPVHWVSGDLWNSFGDILRVKQHFSVADLGPGQGPPEIFELAMREPTLAENLDLR